MADRAKQFMPFAALKGYYDIVEKQELVKIPKREPSDDDAEKISCMLGQTERGMMIKVVHYSDGFYKTTEGIVSEIDFVFRFLVIVKTKIFFDDIYDISGEKLMFEER